MSRQRGFELVKGEIDTNLLPKRETENSAGYDLKVSKEVTIKPGEIALIETGLKAYMEPNEVLLLFDRSSNPRKKGIVLINSVGVIDSDYYENESNDGLIMAQMMNISNNDVTIPYGERIVQGVFMEFKVVDDDNATGKRVGGIGSTK